MLTGRRAFSGETSRHARHGDQREPDWGAAGDDAAARPSRPGPLPAQGPARRLRDTGDARMQLDEGFGPPRRLSRPRRARRLGWRIPAALAAAVVAGIALGWLGRPAPAGAARATPPVQLDLLLPQGAELFTLSSARLAISPDGGKIASRAGAGGSRQAYVRALDAPDAVPVRGTDAAFSLAFSPDGQSLQTFLSRATDPSSAGRSAMA